MRIEFKVYNDNGALLHTLTADPEKVQVEDIYEQPEPFYVYDSANSIRPPKHKGLDIHLTNLRPDNDGAVYRILDEVLSKLTKI